MNTEGMKGQKVCLQINDRPCEAPAGMTLLQAAKGMGIDIPALCHHPWVSRTGSCRVCIVEVDGVVMPACATEVREGMSVYTNSPYVEDLRRNLIDLILSDHPYDCMVCQKTGACELQELAYKYSIRFPSFRGSRRIYKKRDGNPFIERDMEKCILCGRCIKVCEEIQGVGAIDYAYKGFETKICPPFERDLDCEFCGQCVAVCPTGALVGRQWIGKGRYWKIREVDTTCPFCGTGCSLTLHVKENEIVHVTAREEQGVNQGLLCVKGRFGYGFVGSKDRLRTPLVRKDGKLVESDWDEALDFAARRLLEVRDLYGPDAIGGLSSARCTNEDNYVFQKMFRAGLGTNNVDHCARL